MGKSRSKSRGERKKWWKKSKCYGCQEIGHTKKFCPKRKKNKDQEESKGEVEVTQDGYESSEVLVVSTCESERNWILDSGCSFHMTPNRNWFECFKEIKGGQVILGNNKSCDVFRKGTVRTKMHDGIERLLQQVRYIPSLKRNLISLGTLDKRGYEYKASGGVMTVTRGCLVVMKGHIENGLYVRQGSTVIRSVFAVEENADSKCLL